MIRWSHDNVQAAAYTKTRVVALSDYVLALSHLQILQVNRFCLLASVKYLKKKNLPYAII